MGSFKKDKEIENLKNYFEDKGYLLLSPTESVFEVYDVDVIVEERFGALPIKESINAEDIIIKPEEVEKELEILMKNAPIDENRFDTSKRYFEIKLCHFSISADIKIRIRITFWFKKKKRWFMRKIITLFAIISVFNEL